MWTSAQCKPLHAQWMIDTSRGRNRSAEVGCGLRNRQGESEAHVKRTALNRILYVVAQLIASSARFLLSLVTALLLPSWSWGGDVQSPNPFAIQQFSATRIMTVPREKQYGLNVGDITSKIYKSGNKLREDTPTTPEIPELPSGPIGYTLTLLNGNENTVYEIIAGQCISQMIAPASVLLVVKPNPFAAAGEVARKELGTEVVDGHSTKVAEISITKDRQKVVYKAWLATDLHDFPVRVETSSSTTYTFKDVSLSDPPPSLFAEPTNCTKVYHQNPLMQVVPAQPKPQSK
jgi:hypothetical protein